jgi:hypothetical protein
MVVIVAISVVAALSAAVAGAVCLSWARARRRRRMITVFPSAISVPGAAPRAIRPVRRAITVRRLRHSASGANVEVLADYRKARAAGSRHPRATSAGASHGAPSHPSEPA